MVKIMREITTITKVYTYNELCTEAQASVKQWLLVDYSRSETFSTIVSEELKENFPNSELNIQYSLSSCQGDGLNIYGKLCLFDMLGKLEKYTGAEKQILENYLEKIGYPSNSFTFEINERYCYGCKFIDKKYVEEYVNNIIEELKHQGENDINISLIAKFLTDTINYFENLDRDYEKTGYEYLYEIDEEEVIDICEANQYEFLADGTIY